MIDQKGFWIGLAVGLIAVVLAGKCAKAECLPSAEAVRAAHHSHPYWSYQIIKGRKCWYAEGFRDKSVAAGPVPTPRVKPQVKTPVPVMAQAVAEQDRCWCAGDFDFSSFPAPASGDLRERFEVAAWGYFLSASRSLGAAAELRLRQWR